MVKIRTKSFNPDLYTVKYVSNRKLHDYSGMNSHAAKSMGFHKIPKRTIWIARTGANREQVKKHEMVEDYEMSKGKTYFKAHLIALKEQEKSYKRIKRDLK